MFRDQLVRVLVGLSSQGKLRRARLMWCPTTPITAVELGAASGTCYLPVPQSFLNPLHPWLPCLLVSLAYPGIWPKSSTLSSLSPSNYSLLRLRLRHMSIHSHNKARECHKMPKCITWVLWMFFAAPAVWKQPTSSCWSGSITPVRW